MDNDLLDVHLHADQVTPAGLRAFVAQVQQERELVRRTFQEIQDQCLRLETEDLTAAKLQSALKAVDLYINELENAYELDCHINWRELV